MILRLLEVIIGGALFAVCAVFAIALTALALVTVGVGLATVVGLCCCYWLGSVILWIAGDTRCGG